MGSGQNMGVGDPICAPDHSTVSQSCCKLLRDLHTPPSGSNDVTMWREAVTDVIINRMKMLPQVVEGMRVERDLKEALNEEENEEDVLNEEDFVVNVPQDQQSPAKSQVCFYYSIEM